MKRIIIAALTFGAMAGCTRVDELDSYNSSDDGSVAFSITNIEATRATLKESWATQGDVVGISTSNNDFNVPYDVVDGTTTTLSAQDKKIYYASHSQEMDFVSYYPYSETNNSAASVAIDVATDQVDLLVSKVVTNTESSGTGVEFTYYHALSYVGVTLKSSDMIDLSESNDLKIYIGEAPTKATYNLFAQSIELDADAGSVDFEIDSATASAIVLPYDYTNVALYFSFSDKSGTPRLFYKTLGTEFSSGYKYNYTATVGYDNVELKLDEELVWDSTDVDASTSVYDLVFNSTGENDIYEIYTAKGLKAFANLVNGVSEDAGAVTYGTGIATFSDTNNADIHGKLMKNIDLSSVCYSGNNWTPIGENGYKYSGKFDGNGFEVSGLYVNSTTNGKMGLFAYIGNGGVVCNLGVSGSVTSGTSENGGLVGWNEGFVINCYSLVNVKGTNNIGGIAGYNSGNVANCYNRGNIEGVNNVAGIVGQNYTGGYVGYSFSTGEIKGTLRYGGVVGWNYTTSPVDAPTIKGCFSLDNTPYSIGQLGYAASTGPYDGNVYDEAYLKSTVFATIIENGAFTYNKNEDDAHDVAPIAACAWRDNSTHNYPTLDIGKNADEIDWIYDIVYNSGTYEIYSAKGLEYFAALVNGTTLPASATADTEGGVVTSGGDAYFVDLGGLPQPGINGSILIDKDSEIALDGTWTPIGNYSDSNTPKYTGTFAGNNRKITGLSTDSSKNYQGLFGYVDNATISGIYICEGSVKGGDYVGGVVGYANNSSTISGCYNTSDVDGDDVTGSGDYVGGVVGYANNSSTISGCYNTSDVKGDNDTNSGSYVGGVVGYADSSTVSGCYNTGDVNGRIYKVGGVVGCAYSSTISGCYNDGGSISGGSSGYVGGVVGQANYSSTVSGCYNTGDITGKQDYVGGVVGDIVDSSSSVTSCYSCGAVSSEISTTYIGGVVGYNNDSGTISYCYYDYSTIGTTNTVPTTAVGGYPSATTDTDNVKGLSTENMQEEDVVNDLNDGAYIYNQTANAKATIGAWVYNSGNQYPTIDASATPIMSGIDIAYINNTYDIFTAKGLTAFADLVNGNTISSSAVTYGDGFSSSNTGINGKLMDNINLNGNSWTPIGDASHAYTGTFNGKGFEVQNISIDASSSDYQGLFGYISGATIKYLGVTGGSITGEDYVGGIVGYAISSSTITACYNSNAVTGSSNVGGIVGYVANSSVTYCYSYGTVSGSSSSNVGGVVGCNISSTITSCYYDTVTVGSTDNPSTAVGGTDDSDDIASGYAGLTTDEMTDETLYDYLNTASPDTWTAVTGSYPTFSWQVSGY